MNIKNIQTSLLRRDEEQPRNYFDDEAMERLITSIKDNGIESPITVRQNGKGYIIVDGERRWKAATAAGVEEMPCIVTDKEDILEQQLRSDCLKEGLTVDELDRAIYKYYVECKDSFGTSSKTGRPAKNEAHSQILIYISKEIGKSDKRVSKAIDRFEFKRDNADFTKQIEEKYNPDKKRFGKVNSTIAMTDKLKDKPELRKATVDAILSGREENKFMINNESAKRKVDIIAKKAKDDNIEPEDIKPMFDNMPTIDEKFDNMKKDPRYIFQKQYLEFMKVMDAFYDYEFHTVKHVVNQGDFINRFIEESEKLTKYLKDMKE